MATIQRYKCDACGHTIRLYQEDEEERPLFCECEERGPPLMQINEDDDAE